MKESAIVAIASSLKKGPKKEKIVDEHHMKRLAFEGCVARIVEGINKKENGTVEYALKDFIELCLDDVKERESDKVEY